MLDIGPQQDALEGGQASDVPYGGNPDKIAAHLN